MEKNFILKFFLFGLLLRLFLMPFTGHWDLTSLHLVAETLFRSGTDAAYQHYFAIYPPLTYVFLGFWQKIVSPFAFSDFGSFLSEPNIMTFSNPHAFRYLFLLKLPYLFFDLAIGFILADFFKDAQKEKIFKLWMLNPISLYAVFAWGAIDIIPTFISVLALYLVKKNHGFWAALSLGIGGSFKAFPLLLLPVLVLIIFRKNKTRLLAFFLGFFPFGFSLLPFISNKNFLIKFFSSDKLQVIQHASFYIGREQFISIFYIFYVILLIFLFRTKVNKENLGWFFFLVIFAFYAISAFTPQWFVWGLPFLFLVLVEYKLSFRWYLLFLALYFALVVLFEISLNLGLFSPLDISFLEYPSLGEKASLVIDPNRINGLIRSILAGMTFCLIYITRPKKLYGDS